MRRKSNKTSHLRPQSRPGFASILCGFGQATHGKINNPSTFAHMLLHFGLDFDGPVLRPARTATTDALWLGPRGLLRWLEARLGVGGYPENTDYLRIELFRQALQQHLADSADEVPFFAASFEADRFATAEVLLGHRDALLLAGWDFLVKKSDSVPARLRTLAAVEAIFRAKCAAPPLSVSAVGEADRWVRVLAEWAEREVDVTQVFLFEKKELLPVHFQRVMRIFEEKKIPVVEQPDVPQALDAHSALGRFQAHFFQEKNKNHPPVHPTTGQPNVVVLRARRDSDLATFVAQTLARNPDWHPTLLLPELSRTLEQALVLEGLPAQGIRAASLARPALQVLKLAPVFLWEPVDVFKIMEFLTLAAKPLDRGLALEIARVLAQRPGLFSDAWYGAVLGYLDRPEVRPEARAQYEFWFQRRRYPADQAAPKRDAIGLFGYLQTWAHEYHEQTNGKDPSLLALAEQARRIRDLLEALPEASITFLELERIVRTIYEPLPAQLADAEARHLPYVHQAGGLVRPAEELIWWNCVYHNDAPPPDFWQPTERAWLEEGACAPEHPQVGSQRRLVARMRPILRCQRRLWLVVPDQTDGNANVQSLLLGDLEALLGSLADVTYNIDNQKDRTRLAALLVLPEPTELAGRLLSRPRAHIGVPPVPDTAADPDAYHTPTGLETLLYYPHRWYLQQRAGIRATNLLSVTRDNTLLGNLAHRFFESLLKENFSAFERADVHAWVEGFAPDLLEKEGATLLLYGREPERKSFLQQVKNAAWNLISIIRHNGWTVQATEHPLMGVWGGLPIRGKADLVLQRGHEQAIVDLKWSGATRRKELIANGEDLQLVLYAHLLSPGGEWPHTAYFMLNKGVMIARNRAAFGEAQVAGKGDDAHGEVCARILERMEKTYAWRMGQLQAGWLEIRTQRTAPELDSLYSTDGQLFDLLEMKHEDARFDDFRTLIEFMG
jgi:hypothetical protein